MWLLPYVHLRLQSNRSPEDLVAAIQRVTRPEKLEFRLRRRKDDVPFAGDVSKERLRLRWTKLYRNSFRPFVNGRIVDSPLGARIEAVMHPHVIPCVFLAVWGSIAGALAFLAAREFFPSKGLEGLEWLAPLGVFLFVYALCMGSFVPQALAVKRLLTRIAGAEAFEVTRWPA